MNSNLVLTEINIYPVKSLRGISLKEVEVEDRGLKFDRRWMLVDQYGEFITQRLNSKLALLQPIIRDKYFEVHEINNENDNIKSPISIDSGNEIKVKIWQDTVIAYSAANHINNWFSNYLGAPCSLVYMLDSTQRKVDQNYSKNNAGI